MKKTILLSTLLILSICTYAQTLQIDSLKSYLTFKKDDFTDNVKLIAVDTLQGVSKDGYLYVIQPEANVRPGMRYKNFTLKIGCSKLACVDNSSSIDYILTNDDKFRIQNGSEYNCMGVFFSSWVEMSGHYKDLDKLATTPIKAIRLNSRLSSTEIYLTTQQAIRLNNQIKWFKYFYDNRSKIDKLKIY